MFYQPSFTPPRAWLYKSSPQERILTQWRGLNTAPLEKAAASNNKKAGDVLPGILKKLGLEERRSQTEMLKVWNNILDPNIVSHAKPTGLFKGTLFVTVDSHVWLDEIVRYRRKEILDRLQHAFGKDLIIRISFRVG